MHDDYHDTLARARLRVLIGAAVNDLPGDFIVRLGRVLAEENGEDAGGRTAPRLTLVPKNDDDATAGRESDAPSSGVDGATGCLQARLRGLDAIMELLHAAHLDQRAHPASPALTESLVEGLILAGRELVCAMAADA